MVGHVNVVEIGDAEARPTGMAVGVVSNDEPVLRLLQEMSGRLARLEGRALQGQDDRDVEAAAASIPSAACIWTSDRYEFGTKGGAYLGFSKG